MSRDSHDLQDLFVPFKGIQIHEHGSTGICHLGDMVPAVGPTGEPPNKPGFHRPKKGLASLCRGAGFRDVVQDPFNFRPRKIGGDGQTGFVPEPILAALPGKLITDFAGAGALPYNGVGERIARIFVPDYGGFPLIGDTDGGQFRPGNTSFCQCSANDILGVLPDF